MPQPLRGQAGGQAAVPKTRLRIPFYIDLDTQPRNIVHDQVAVLEAVVVGKDFVGKRCMRHQLLDAEVGHPHAEVHRRGHAYRR